MMRKQKYNVSVDPAANERMLDHVRFLAQVSISAAEKLYNIMVEAIAELENNPEICPIYTIQNLVDAELRYKLCGKRYRMVFEIVKNNIYVYDIQDCRQDSDKNLV